LQFDGRRIKKLTLLVGAAYSGIGGECGEKCRAGRRACFNYPDKKGFITAKGQGLKTLRIQKSEWGNIVDAAREHAGNSDLPIWSAMVNYYGVCITSVVTELSFKLWSLYQRIDGTKNETYGSYYDLPAFWISACDVIDREIARIDKIRNDKAQREQREMLRHLGQNRHGHK